MKISEEDRKKLRELMKSMDWDEFHGEYDAIISRRLRELDGEFMEDLGKESEGATFWFA